MRLLSAYLILFFGLASTVYGQSKYSDRRLKADTDPRTLRARKEFNQRTTKSFIQSRRVYRVENIELELNSRLVSQYGRGKSSAIKVIPQEIDQILGLISEAKYSPYDLAICLKDLHGLRHIPVNEILEAVKKLGDARIIKIDYWGYMIQKERPPVYNSDDRRLTYKARWHEADSYYEAYSADAARENIIKAVLNEREKAWYEIW